MWGRCHLPSSRCPLPACCSRSRCSWLRRGPRTQPAATGPSEAAWRGNMGEKGCVGNPEQAGRALRGSPGPQGQVLTALFPFFWQGVLQTFLAARGAQPKAGNARQNVMCSWCFLLPGLFVGVGKLRANLAESSTDLEGFLCGEEQPVRPCTWVSWGCPGAVAGSLSFQIPQLSGTWAGGL